MRRNDLLFNLLLVPLDFILLVSAALAAYYLRISPVVEDIRPVLFELPVHRFLILAGGASLFLMLLFAISGLYLVKRTTPILQEITKIAMSVSAGMALIVLVMFFNRAWFDSRFIFLADWILAISFVAVGRIVMRQIRKLLLYTKGIGTERVLILGKGKDAERIAKQISQNKKLGLRLVETLPSPELKKIRSIHEAQDVHHILTADMKFDRKNIMRVVSFCEENGIQFSYVPDMLGAILAEMSSDVLEGIPIVYVKPSPLDGWKKILKRGFDVLAASLLFIVFSPLFFIFAFVIKWESKGPVFVKLKRVSNGKEFELYKFRSMIDNAHEYKSELMEFNERGEGPLFKLANDPRITRIGKFLRAHRFDELPQLINVLKGNMSLVGPRPHEPQEIKQYKNYHKKVLAIKSGLTGLAQVNGASDLPFDEEVQLDRFYIENWSLKHDIKILAKTIKMFLFDKSGI